MQRGFGGPVWHASVHAQGTNPVLVESLLDRAERALNGVGAAMLGQWIETSSDGRTLHLKRRLSPEEWGDKPWGFDLRHTEEGQARILAAGCPQSVAEKYGEW